jgi:trans-2,3-dihydro-3-hydroxyanthranilate isomerase
LTLGAKMPVDLLAACIGLSHGDIVATAHRPVVASVGNSFCIVEVAADALSRAVPDIGRFREAAKSFTALGPNRLPLYLYARDGADRLRARMFSPLSGTTEDPATGSAATPLAALLLSLGGDSERRYQIRQGVEMGRPSLLLCTARRGADGIRASVGGGCVPVLKGEVSL